MKEITVHKLVPPPYQEKELQGWRPGNVCGQKGPGSSSWDHVDCKSCKKLKRKTKT